jgi:acetoin utilization deacetylase AcuC-like enzyme
MVRAFWLSTGGTILASRLALERGIACNIGGGFHHAFPGHGEGFCAIHDVAVAIRKLQRDGIIQKAMVIDCDVHHGNGTAAIFQGDPTVFTLSIHQFNNYPAQKPPSTMDIHLEDGVSDEEYLRRLRDACRTAIPLFRPDLVCYVAGADPYCEDQLGGLNLSMIGLRERDRLVTELALTQQCPVSITLAGGYAAKLEDTVRIHAHTIEEAEEVLRMTPWRVVRETRGRD